MQSRRENTTEEDKVHYRIDVIWHQIQEMKLSAGDNFQIKLLLKVGNIGLITPHSKAGIGQVHSLASKNKPEGSERNRMGMDEMLLSILGVKPGRPESTCTCHNFNASQKISLLSEKSNKDLL